MPNLQKRDGTEHRPLGRSASTTNDMLAKITAIHERLLDRAAASRSPSDAYTQQIQRSCGLWAAARRSRLRLSDEAVLQQTGLDSRALALLETGLADPTLGNDRSWDHLIMLLASDQLDTDWVAEVVSAARGQLSSDSVLLVRQIARDFSPHARLPKGRVLIFDTTLCDGTRAPGRTLDVKQRADIAVQLCQLGVDIIEAGYPGGSKEDLESVREIAKKAGAFDRPKTAESDDMLGRPIIAATAYVYGKQEHKIMHDINEAWEALQPALYRRINIAFPTSDIMLAREDPDMTHHKALERVWETVTYACYLGADVQFTAMYATEADRTFLFEIVSTAIQAGAETITIADTSGNITNPNEYGELISEIFRNVPNAIDVIIAAHCHNDLGMAVANSLAGLCAGARQIECTINGIGERAGNAALEEVVVVLEKGRHIYGAHTLVDTLRLWNASQLVSQLTCLPIPPNKPIVGPNAGDWRSLNWTSSRLNKYTTRPEFAAYLKSKGFNLTDVELNQVFKRFKHLAHTKAVVNDHDVARLLTDRIFFATEPHYRLADMFITCGTRGMASAEVHLIDGDGPPRVGKASGVGPVAALSRAIDSIIELRSELIEIAITAMTVGVDAYAEVTVYVREDRAGIRDVDTSGMPPVTFCGYASHLDTIVATGEAYIDAMNQMVSAQCRRQKVLLEQERMVQAALRNSAVDHDSRLHQLEGRVGDREFFDG